MDRSIRSFFEERYEDHWYFTARATILSVFIRRFAPPADAGTVADVGAGTGKILFEVKGKARAVALEAAADLARAGAGRYRLPYVIGSLSEGVPFRRDALDLLLALDVLEHLDDDRRTLGELFAALRRGGRLVISVPAFRWLWSRHDDLHHHRRRYSRQGLVDVLESAGFVCERVTYYNTLLFPVVCLSRALERVSARWAGAATDYDRAPGVTGRLLGWLFRQEARMVTRCRLPVGVSLLAVARRP